LGWLGHARTDGKAAPRGEGIELRTDAAAAIRAAKGLLLTAEAQPHANGAQLERQLLRQLLDAALQLAERQGEQALHQHANQPETGHGNQRIDDDAVPAGRSEQGHQAQLAQALHDLENGSNTAKQKHHGGQRLIAASGPDGIALASGQSMTLTAQTNIDQIAQRDSNQTSGRRWIHNVGESISLFVGGAKAKVKDTFKLIAAKGGMTLQAQDGPMSLAAQQELTISSVGGKVVIQAPQEILLAAGGGYIRIGRDIEVHCPGQQSQKAAKFDLNGPASLSASLPSLPQATARESARFSQQIDLSDFIGMDPETRTAIRQMPYEVRTPDGKVIQRGFTDLRGDTARIYTDSEQKLILDVGDGEWSLSMDMKHRTAAGES
ncbi:Uncharacterized conserved protein, DUF2345 family, partial [Noviherbaspirillum humi]